MLASDDDRTPTVRRTRRLPHVLGRHDEWHQCSYASGLGIDTQRYRYNVARTIGLQEQRIDTTILVGSGNAMPCRSASFNVPLRIGSDAFDIDVFLLDISNDVYIILVTPWLAILGSVTWDFTDMELRYLRNGHYHILHPVQRRQTNIIVRPLQAPPTLVRSTNVSTLQTHHPLTNRSQ